MKNKCKHRNTSILSEANTFTHIATVLWCRFCGATRYNWDNVEYNKKYGKWRSPKYYSSPEPKKK